MPEVARYVDKTWNISDEIFTSKNLFNMFENPIVLHQLMNQ